MPQHACRFGSAGTVPAMSSVSNWLPGQILVVYRYLMAGIPGCPERSRTFVTTMKVQYL